MKEPAIEDAESAQQANEAQHLKPVGLEPDDAWKLKRSDIGERMFRGERNARRKAIRGGHLPAFIHWLPLPILSGGERTYANHRTYIGSEIHIVMELMARFADVGDDCQAKEADNDTSIGPTKSDVGSIVGYCVSLFGWFRRDSLWM